MMAALAGLVRHLIPRIQASRWSGAALTRDPDPALAWEPHDDADGYCVCVQWLGLIIEIAAGRVHR